MSRAIDIPTADGTIDALIFTPDNADGPLPAVVLFTDIGGLRPCYHEKAQRIADNGYAVLMPNVYYRDATGQIVPEGKSFRDPDVRPTLVEYAGHLTPETQSRDFIALLECLDAEAEFAGGKLGVVGYCMTGASHCAWRPSTPTAWPPQPASTRPTWRRPTTPRACGKVDTIEARVYFGHADKDELLPAEQIARMDEALATAGVHFTTALQGAAHGFTAKDAPSYDAAADALHHKRLATLLEETL